MVGERINRLRIQLALTHRELADLLEVDPRAVVHWEVGRTPKGPCGATLLLLRALEDACGRDPSFGAQLREWVPLGQCYVLRRLTDATP